MTPIFLTPGDGAYAEDANKATLRVLADGFLYRNGVKYVLGSPPVALAAAKLGIYGQNLFARGKTDGLLWLSTPTKWQQVTDTSTVDPDFLAQMMKDGADEPV